LRLDIRNRHRIRIRSERSLYVPAKCSFDSFPASLNPEESRRTDVAQGTAFQRKHQTVERSILLQSYDQETRFASSFSTSAIPRRDVQAPNFRTMVGLENPYKNLTHNAAFVPRSYPIRPIETDDFFPLSEISHATRPIPRGTSRNRATHVKRLRPIIRVSWCNRSSGFPLYARCFPGICSR